MTIPTLIIYSNLIIMKKYNHELIALYVIISLIGLILVPIIIAFVCSAFGHKEVADSMMLFMSKKLF